MGEHLTISSLLLVELEGILPSHVVTRNGRAMPYPRAITSVHPSLA
jgi:hypothetical protein